MKFAIINKPVIIDGKQLFELDDNVVIITSEPKQDGGTVHTGRILDMTDEYVILHCQDDQEKTYWHDYIKKIEIISISFEHNHNEPCSYCGYIKEEQ